MLDVFAGTVITKLYKHGTVHSLLVQSANGSVGRLPLDEPQGNAHQIRRRRFEKGTQLPHLARIYLNAENGHMVFSEKAALSIRRRKRRPTWNRGEREFEEDRGRSKKRKRRARLPR